MHKKFKKVILTSLLLVIAMVMMMPCIAQRIPQVPDSIRQKYKPPQQFRQKEPAVDLSTLNQDSLIKLKLVSLALNNPNIRIAEAQTRIAEADLKKARTSWLNSVSVGANVNEFVIQNSAAASFFPKYNIGAIIPLDIISRTKRDKTVAKENITINQELKKDKEKYLATEVLLRYENYKEKREIVILQRSYMEYDFSAYEAAQRAYASGDMLVEDMNRTHQIYLTEQAKLVTKERDMNIAIIQLEELIGMPLDEALKLP